MAFQKRRPHATTKAFWQSEPGNQIKAALKIDRRREPAGGPEVEGWLCRVVATIILSSLPGALSGSYSYGHRQRRLIALVNRIYSRSRLAIDGPRAAPLTPFGFVSVLQQGPSMPALNLGSIREYGRKFRNKVFEGPQGRAIARSTGFHA